MVSGDLWQVWQCALIKRVAEHVDTVIVDGRVVVERGRMTMFDEDELYEQIRNINWAQLFKDRVGLSFKMRWPVS
jgi:23S rRNA G2445 N2-methylase RlmL